MPVSTTPLGALQTGYRQSSGSPPAVDDNCVGQQYEEFYAASQPQSGPTMPTQHVSALGAPVGNTTAPPVPAQGYPRADSGRAERHWRGLTALFVAPILTMAVIVGATYAMNNTAWGKKIIWGNNVPALPPDASKERLLPIVNQTTWGKYAFMETLPSGKPVTFDPCRPIHYVMNTAKMPPGGEQIVREAITDITVHTGLKFTYDGVTSEQPDDGNQVRGRDSAGRWKPVLIAWSDPQSSPRLNGDVAGYGGPQAASLGGKATERYVTGQVVIDRSEFADLDVHRTRMAALSTIKHELAHLVGLAHVDSAVELMNANYYGQVSWGPGDLQGLALVGSGKCHTDM